MNTNENPMDRYREIAKTNEDVAVLVGMIDWQKTQVTRLLEHIVKETSRRAQSVKISTQKDD